MATNDVYKIVSKGVSNGQAVVNIYHYWTFSGSTTASDMADFFRNTLLPAVASLCSTSTHFQSVEVKNLQNPLDFAALTYDVQGIQSGENLPTHDAVSFTYLVNRSDAKSGGKRFGQIVETVQNNGVPSALYNTFLVSCETVLSNLYLVAGGAMAPVVLGKRRGQLGVYPNQLAGVRFFGFTTQNNRKFYKSVGL